MRVEISPELLRWAREREGIDIATLCRRFPKYAEWERGETLPTLKQLERFATFVHAPVGTLFLPKPPAEPFPIPDFRTGRGTGVKQPSPNLRDMIYLCKERQEWYREYSIMEGDEPLPFVGASNIGDDIEGSAGSIRAALGLDMEERYHLTSWRDALRQFIKRADSLGVLVMVSGVVGTSSSRKLDPDEFRGFALSDEFAPLIFINGRDTKAAQMFTLAHELAHLWLGESALSNCAANSAPHLQVEKWCNKVAAELLVPLVSLREEFRSDEDLTVEMKRLAKKFKVSTLVILRRIADACDLTQDEFRQAYDNELRHLRSFARSTGGDFYSTQIARVGHRFAEAVVTKTLEGHTLYRDACDLLGFSKTNVVHKLAERLATDRWRT